MHVNKFDFRWTMHEGTVGFMRSEVTPCTVLQLLLQHLNMVLSSILSHHLVVILLLTAPLTLHAQTPVLNSFSGSCAPLVLEDLGSTDRLSFEGLLPGALEEIEIGTSDVSTWDGYRWGHRSRLYVDACAYISSVCMHRMTRVL